MTFVVLALGLVVLLLVWFGVVGGLRVWVGVGWLIRFLVWCNDVVGFVA